MRRTLLMVALLMIFTLAGGSVIAQDATATPVPPITTPQDAALSALIFDTRADLEVLANLVFGEGARPDSWTFNTDVESPTAVADLWFDNEQLADEVFGAATRPPEWFGATTTNRATLTRNIRHDLELSADQALGVNVRPTEWRGAPPAFRCERTLQNILDLLDRFYGVQATTPESVLDYCRAVAAEVEDDLVEAVYTTEQLAQLPSNILAIRGDLERLADETLGLNNRPTGWIGNRDVNSPTLIGDIFLDLESLANVLMETAGQRPAGWIGGITNTPATSYQNLRHDLELLADVSLGVDERPFGWQGVDPILRCEPLVQNLVYLAEQEIDFTPTGIDPQAADYCVQIAVAVNQAVENPPILDVVETDEDERRSGESNYAFTYLDVSATQYMGIMPAGTRFRAWYRNFGESNMMFVSGDDFAVFIDYRFTTLSPMVFDTLPTLENVSPMAFCDASWCNGPGPTPTPTGFGPLAAVLNNATPPSPAPENVTPGVGPQEKVQVAWNHIRVTYLQDDPTTRTAQVALEICRQPAQVATTCEPVIGVTDTATNTARVPLTTYNGLNVYEFRYGYTANVLIEGETTFSTDIWISDPTIR